jgi:CheY-like chemotaxis protein
MVCGLTIPDTRPILAADFSGTMNGNEMSRGVKAKLRLLAVDDEPGVCECLKLILALDGHTVVTAGNALEGLALYKPGEFDVVCTDYSMPGMKGDQFAAAIKSISPSQPVIMITGLACTMTKPAAADLLLTKPFVPNDLRRAFQQLFQYESPIEPSPTPLTDDIPTPL